MHTLRSFARRPCVVALVLRGMLSLSRHLSLASTTLGRQRALLQWQETRWSRRCGRSRRMGLLRPGTCRTSDVLTMRGVAIAGRAERSGLAYASGAIRVSSGTSHTTLVSPAASSCAVNCGCPGNRAAKDAAAYQAYSRVPIRKGAVSS